MIGFSYLFLCKFDFLKHFGQQVLVTSGSSPMAIYSHGHGLPRKRELDGSIKVTRHNDDYISTDVVRIVS